jgi:predicted RNA-binding Zn-ribbon protein involved in translation (DUF1610 family)
MHQLSSKPNSSLRSKCYFLVGYQLGSVALLLSSGILWERYSNDYIIFLAMVFFVILSGFAVYKLYVNSQCPQCRNNFFYKSNNPMNLGFSLYTHKCTNCGYKLKKGE